jgi:putative hemin transport protein
MHLKLEASQTAWVVRKPTSEGNVTSIEVFDAEKNMIAQFFGLRKPGIPELEAWKQLVDSLPKL